jgi:hypothetical protein
VKQIARDSAESPSKSLDYVEAARRKQSDGLLQPLRPAAPVRGRTDASTSRASGGSGAQPRLLQASRDLVQFKPEPGTFSHMFGYMMEALVDCGETDLPQKAQQAEAIQHDDGSIPPTRERPGVSPRDLRNWLCVAEARRAAAQRRRRHVSSGCSIGAADSSELREGAIYFTKEEISWAVKFFIDAGCLPGHARRRIR